jgi:sugar lactone lactonase YvrE
MMRVILLLTLLGTPALAQIQDGYTELIPDAGSPLPAGTALFSYTNGSGILVSEAGVGASTLIQSGRIFVDEVGAKTGIALVNPSSQDAQVTLTLRDASGTSLDSGSLALPAHQHIARYLSDLFPNRPSNLTGSLTFDSNVGLAAITLRETRNAEDEPIYTTIPVLDLTATMSGSSVLFPHIAAGGGFTTQILLMNSGAQSLHGRVDFIDSNGQPLPLRLDTSNVSSLQYDIAPQGVYRAEVDGFDTVVSGYAVLTPNAGTAAPLGTIVFRLESGGNVVTEAGVAAGAATTASRIFVDYIGTQTGVALANPGDVPANITLNLLDRFGFPEASIQQALPARNHTAKFVHEMFPISDGFTGLLEIRSDKPVVSMALKLTINGRNELVLATLPSADLIHPETAAPIVFPHIVIGGGFATRLILINTSTTAASTGQIAFYKPDGSAFTVPMTGQTASQFAYRITQGGGRQLHPGNAAPLASISLIADPLAVQTTSELLINEGNVVYARFQMVDNSGTRRDDFDPSIISLDSSIASVLDPVGVVQGSKAGFSTLSVTASGAVTTFTATVVQVDSGANGFAITGIAQDSAHRLYLASSSDNAVLLAQDLKQTPIVYAGVSGSAGLRNDVRQQSLFNHPAFIALNQADGSLYLSDAANNVIRRVRSGPSGRVETFAGSGTRGAADGAAGAASFSNPQGVALDSKGNLWVADSGNHTIRRINLATGVVNTVAGQAGVPGTADGEGGSARFNAPAGIAVEVESAVQALQRQLQGTPPPPVSVIVADSGNGVVRRVKETGEVETIRTITPIGATAKIPLSRHLLETVPAPPPSPSFTTPLGIAIDPAGNIYLAEPGTGKVNVILENGRIVPAAQPGTFDGPQGIAIAETGKVLVTGNGPTARLLVYGQPQAALVSPNHFGSSGGQNVVIKGSNFAPDTLVIIGDTVINGNVTDTQTITFSSPPLPSGRSTLTVVNRGGLAQTPVTIDAIPFNQLPVGYITTIAGGSTYAGEGALATASPIAPNGVAVDANGNFIILDSLSAKIRRVDSLTGIVTTVAGNGQGNSFGDNGPAVAAGIGSNATSIAFDSAGNLLIADNGIRRIDATTGIIKTIVGGGYGTCGDGQDALNACFNYLIGFTLDSKGNIYIADRFNNRIRKVDAATNILTTLAGDGRAGFTGDGGDARSASLNEPFGVAVDEIRNAVYIADNRNGRIRKVDLVTNTITTFAGGGLPTADLGDKGLATAASLSPDAVAVDPSGNVFISDPGRIRKVDITTGIITTVAGHEIRGSDGDGGLAVNASLGDQLGIALDAAGDLLIADYYQSVVRRVDGSTHVITTIAGNRQDEVADDGVAATAATLVRPTGLTVDASENLFFTSGFRVRRVDGANGIIHTIVSDIETGGGRTVVDDAGNVYIPDRYGYSVLKVLAGSGMITTIAGTGEPRSFGDGGPATSAGVLPDDLALDRKNGILYIAESSNPGGAQRVRKVNLSSGLITAVAGSTTGILLSGYLRIATDPAGNLYILDGGKGVILRVDAATQAARIVAGGGTIYSDNQPATSAALRPVALDVDAAGNLYILDYNYPISVRKVDASSGIIHSLVAFNGSADSAAGIGDNGPANAASVNYPSDVTVDTRGNVYIADTDNSRIRIIRGPLP